RRGQPLDVGDAFSGVNDRADLFAARRLRLVVGDEPLQGVPDLLRTDGEFRHFLSLLSACVTQPVYLGQPAICRRTSPSRVATVPSTTSPPIPTPPPPR